MDQNETHVAYDADPTTKFKVLQMDNFWTHNNLLYWKKKH